MQIIKSLFSGSDSRHILIKSVVALFMRIFGAVISFIFNLVIARKLDLVEAGYFFLCLSIVLFLSAIARLGFENTVLRYTAANIGMGLSIKNILNFAIRRSSTVAMILGLVVFFFASFIAEFIFNKPELASSLKFISPAILGFSIVFLTSMSLQGRKKIILSSVSQNAAHFSLCCAFIVCNSVTDAKEASSYLSLSLGLTASFFYWISISGLGKSGRELDKSQIIKSSRSNWLTSVNSQLIQWGPPILVGIFLAAEQVAYFSVAQRISLLTSFVLMAVNVVVSPKFASYSAINDREGLRRTAIFSVRLLLMSMLPFLILILSFPSNFMELFGAEFIEGASLLQILVVGQAINVVSGPVGYVLMMSGNERDMSLVSTICSVGMLIFVPVMIKLFETTGAALCVAFFVGLQNLLAVSFVQKRLGFNTLKFWQKI